MKLYRVLQKVPQLQSELWYQRILNRNTAIVKTISAAFDRNSPQYQKPQFKTKIQLHNKNKLFKRLGLLELHRVLQKVPRLQYEPRHQQFMSLQRQHNHH